MLEHDHAWERHPGAAAAPLSGYRRREPERTVLHEVVREHLASFLAGARERTATGNGYPRFVERELSRYLDCGVLARGFVRVRCDDCGFERLVALSCKGRAVCPSCNARRMRDTAAHLVDRVLPRAPYRQWVLSFPRRVRFLLACHPRALGDALGIFLRAVFAHQRRGARREGVDVAQARPGSVTFVQRFGGSLNLNVHFHAVVPDGLFALGPAGPVLLPLPPPTDREVRLLLERVIVRTERLLERRGLRELDPEVDELVAARAAAVEGRLPFGGDAAPEPARAVKRRPGTA